MGVFNSMRQQPALLEQLTNVVDCGLANLFLCDEYYLVSGVEPGASYCFPARGSENSCPSGYHCDGATSACVTARRLQRGDACNGTLSMTANGSSSGLGDDGEPFLYCALEDGLYCGRSSRVCEPRIAGGQPCTGELFESDWECESGFTCDGSSCVAQEVAAIGEDCSIQPGSQTPCEPGAVCNQFQTCVPERNLGETCESGDCRNGFRCDGVCEPDSSSFFFETDVSCDTDSYL